MSMPPFRAFRPLALAAALAAVAACASGPAPVTPAPVEVPVIARPHGETPQWWFRAGAAEAAARGAMAAR
ncbi:MAG TPA: alkaline phosphatase, partial [Lysobacter sp.]|nr:alkaline phosphatase [Lysobacter sp.]